MPIPNPDHIGIKFQDSKVLIISKELYEKEPVFAAASQFIDRFFISIEPNDEFSLKIHFKCKDERYDDEFFINNFSNSLIEKQYNFDLQKRFGHIRDMIVEQAFYPLEKI